MDDKTCAVVHEARGDPHRTVTESLRGVVFLFL